MDHSQAQSITERYDNPEELLNEQAAQDIAEHKRIAETQEVSEQRFGASVRSFLEAHAQSGRYVLIGLMLLFSEEMESVMHAVREVDSKIAQISSGAANRVYEGGKMIGVYLVVYIMMVIAIAAVFPPTWALLQPELPKYVAYLASLVMISPSILLSHMHKHSPQPDRFFKWLCITGLCAVGVAGTGIAVSKALLNHLANTATGGILATTSSARADQMLLVISGTTFCAAIAAEASFGAVLAILIRQWHESKAPVEQHEQDLAEATERKDSLKKQAEVLSKWVNAIENIDTFLETWVEKQYNLLMLFYEPAQKRLRSRARSAALRNMDSLSVDDLFNYPAGRSNEQEMEEHDEVEIHETDD